MAQPTNGSGGKPSDSKTPSPEASASNVLLFPTIDRKRRVDLEHQLAGYLVGLEAAVLGHLLTLEELERLTDDAHQFLHDTKRCSCPR
jgi:hypothetical protein